MLIDPYVTDKVRQLEAERARYDAPQPQPVLLVSPLARAAGRLLRRMGDGLESWATSRVSPQQAAGASLRSREERCEGC